ncbi:MAG: hypothetical protein AABX85_02510 [Nanoarchaeota archaeon]
MKKVTIRSLNEEFVKALFSSVSFWISLLFYVIGLIVFSFFPIVGGIMMFISALSMLNADWKGRNKVVKRLRWVR